MLTPLPTLDSVAFTFQRTDAMHPPRGDGEAFALTLDDAVAMVLAQADVAAEHTANVPQGAEKQPHDQPHPSGVEAVKVPVDGGKQAADADATVIDEDAGRDGGPEPAGNVQEPRPHAAPSPDAPHRADTASHDSVDDETRPAQDSTDTAQRLPHGEPARNTDERVEQYEDAEHDDEQAEPQPVDVDRAESSSQSNRQNADQPSQSVDGQTAPEAAPQREPVESAPPAGSSDAKAIAGNKSHAASVDTRSEQQSSAPNQRSEPQQAPSRAPSEHEPARERPATHTRFDRPVASESARPEQLPREQHEPPQSRQRSDGPQRQYVNLEAPRERVDPAVARAAQIEAAVRLENATGQGPASDASTRSAPTLAHGLQSGINLGQANVNTTGEQPGQPLPSATGNTAPVDDARFSARIVRGLTAMINQRGGSMTMRLDPPELGQLRVQMTIARGVVSAQFTASSAQAHALLEQNLPALRMALESQGLAVERLHVGTANSQSSSSHQQAMHDDATDRHQQQRQDAAGGQSRGRRDDAQHEQRSGGRTRASFARIAESMTEPSAAAPAGAGGVES